MKSIACLAGLALVVAAPVAGAAPGIRSIRATPTTLTLRIAAAGVVKLVERQAFEPDASPGRAAWSGTATGTVTVPRFAARRDRLYSRFSLVDRSGRALGPPHWVDDLRGLPRPGFDLPWSPSKKGLFIQDLDEALKLDIKHTVWNLMITQVVDWTGRSRERRDVDGTTVPINMEFIAGLDRTIGRLTDAGVSVTLIVVNGVPRAPQPHNPFIHPNTDLARAPYHLGGFNLRTEKGLRYYRAAFEYLAHRYSRPGHPHGWIHGFIVGNEVQSHWEWFNMGHLAPERFVREYGDALRVADLAARRYHPAMRAYVSMDHFWTGQCHADRTMSMPGRELLERLNRMVKSEGDFPWQVAFHPYPEDLFDPRAWRDRMAPMSFDAPKITFKNLEVLPAYLAQPRLRYAGQPRSVILSEQGMHTPATPDGETLQAAGFAYAWAKVERTPGIGPFIYFEQVDSKECYGLRFGLWTWKEDDPRPDAIGRKKRLYDLFVAAGTPAWEATAAFAKPIIGIQQWPDVGPSPTIERTPDPTPVRTLVSEPGHPRYSIFVPATAGAPVRFAAAELQQFLARISGTSFPIVDEGANDGPGIYLPGTRRAAEIIPDAEVARLKPDGVIQRTSGADLALAGKGDRGALYSVYVLLERYLGVRFLARDCTVAPRQRPLTLPDIDYTHSPPFMSRETLYFDSYPREIAARQRLNGPASKADASTGGKVTIFPYVHSFSKLVPPETYYAQHPEYFSLVGGKRTNQTVHGQLCLSNPDVLRIATAGVLRWIAEHPEVSIFDVSQNDGEGACECDRCAAIVREEGSQHGPILRFVNAIAAEVGRTHPGKWIETLAYAYSTKPPAITRPAPNVIIRLCHAGCYFHGFEACGLGAREAEYLDAWSKVTSRIFIWHYATNFAHYLAPCQNLEGLARDMKYYAAHNVNGLMIQADHQGSGGELAELRQYLAAQLMWDPTRDPEMVRVEFCNGYYGEAAPGVLDFLRLMDEEARKPDVHAFGAWDPSGTTSPELVRRGLVLLRQARARCRDAAVRARVTRLLLPLWYMQLTWPARYGLPAADAPGIVAESKEAAAAGGITYIREDFNSPSMPGWLAEMERRFGPLPAAPGISLLDLSAGARLSHCADWRVSTVEEGGTERLSLFQHPADREDAVATISVTVPRIGAGERLLMRFGTAFTAATANGCRFSVRVNGVDVWQAEQATQPTIAREIDLGRWAGQRVDLSLCVNALVDMSRDWANWVEPTIVVVAGEAGR